MTAPIGEPRRVRDCQDAQQATCEAIGGHLGEPECHYCGEATKRPQIAAHAAVILPTRQWGRWQARCTCGWAHTSVSTGRRFAELAHLAHLNHVKSRGGTR